ncbi:MAG: hypothetical protein GY906_17970 [bacterium]|nr:hypothetical protein [bacterium]
MDSLKIIWECDRCHAEREEWPNCNEGGQCRCGGTYHKVGESYDAREAEEERRGY